MKKKFLFICTKFIFLSLLLASCAQLQPSQLQIETEAVESALLTRKTVLISQLLYEARVAFSLNRLSRPAHDNALDRFRRVLKEDPGNKQALAGIKEVAQRYIELATEARRAGDDKKGLRLLNFAKKIDPDLRHPKNPPKPLLAKPVRSNRPLKNSINAPVKTTDTTLKKLSNTYFLNERDLKSRGSAIKSRLAEIAQRAAALPSRMLIVVRHDADGRWIYQQMRNSVKGVRLRGNISYAKTTKIVLLDAPQ